MDFDSLESQLSFVPHLAWILRKTGAELSLYLAFEPWFVVKCGYDNKLGHS